MEVYQHQSDWLLACALRYFSGASPYDVMMVFGLSHRETFDSVWYVVHAVNCLPDFNISYPACHVKKSIAE